MPTPSLPDPRYLQRCLSPEAEEALEAIRQASMSGDLKKIISIVNNDHHPDPECLEHGLRGAFWGKQLQVARYLLDKGARIDASVTCAASMNKSLPFFELLVDHGWDVNTPVTCGVTTLSYIVRDESLVNWFLDHGADPNLGPPLMQGQAWVASVPDAGDVLDCAAGVSTVTVFDLLLEHGAKLENSLPLHAAAKSDKDGERISMMAHLLELGVDVNGSDDSRGPYGFGTPLHHAIRERHIQIVRFLLGKGANPHIRNRAGDTAFGQAEKTTCAQIIELLKGAVPPENQDICT